MALSNVQRGRHKATRTTCCSCVAPSTLQVAGTYYKARSYNICSARLPTSTAGVTMSLRTRTDRLLEEVGVERTATLNSDVRALAEAVGLGFTSLPATLTALEAEVLEPAQAAPPAQPAEPAAAPAPAEPAADSDSDGFELTGSQTEAERTAAAREEAERRNAVVDVDDDDDDLAGQSVKTLKAMAAARGVDVSTCREKSEIVAALRAPPPEAIVPAGVPAPAPAAPAPEPAATPPPPPPPPQSGAVKRLTRRIISSALKDGASLYDVLGVETSATDRDIKVAYRDIAALIHPDKCSEENATEAFKKVNEANEVLSDAARRSIYDAEQARAAAPAPAEPPSPPAPRRRAPPKRKTPKPKRSKRKAPKRKARAAKRRKAASDDDDDDFIADSDEEEEESEAEESESDDDEEPGCVCHRGEYCRSAVHSCVCATGHYCKASIHLCVCATGQYCKASLHACVCHTGQYCKASNHSCVCATGQYCKATKHKCVCRTGQYCKATTHNCVCRTGHYCKSTRCKKRSPW